jgi:short-subunit dehydrogenase
MSNPHGKGSALITGASSGIGKVYADRLAKRGYDLILVARDQQRLEALAAQLRSETGVAIEVLRADLTAKSDLTRVAQRLRDDAAITILVNNAGLGGAGPIVGTDPDRLDAIIQLNVVAMTQLATAAAPGFAARGHGAIINIGSVLGLAPEASLGNYSATKAYVLAFTQSLNTELVQRGVQLQAVLPGATRTEIWERSGKDVESIPAEMLMETDEMVDAALVGFDRHELVTIPALPEAADWNAFDAARLHLGPNLSRNHAAERYKTTQAAAA